MPTRTIVKVLVWTLLVWAALRSWPELVFLTISLLLAVALEPLVAWLGKRKLSRGMSVVLLTVLLLLLLAAMVGFVLPPLASQGADLVGNFPALRARVQHRLPPGNVVLRTVVDQVLSLPSSPDFLNQVNRPLIWGQAAISGVMTTFFVLVATLYLLLDGKRLYAWLLAYVPRAHRDRMAETVSEVSHVVYGYVRGQLVTSFAFAFFSAFVLTLLGVPAAVPLALLAGACDVIPVVGIVVATAPAALLALTVSPVTCVAVVACYTLYHLLETYLVVPRVYGKTLRLSTLAVLLALIVGGALQGLLGAVLVLPLVAAYPIIERIWLKNYLAGEVLADHSALAHAAETGSDEAVEAVLQGEKHPGEGHTQ